MLELKHINTFYGNIQALKDVSIKVSEGEIISLIGANGAGKTTTLMSISGLVPPRSGEIHFMGKAIHRTSPDRIVAMGVSQVPEGRRIFPYLTVAENLDMGAFLRTDKTQVQPDMEYVFSLFPILANRKNQAGGTLSGGEQQMLAISRALMARPRLLLLDEPVQNLSGNSTNENWGEVQSTSSSAKRLKCIIRILAHAVNSIAKSRSLTASSELAAGRPKPTA